MTDAWEVASAWADTGNRPNTALSDAHVPRTVGRTRKGGGPAHA
ncbi:MAG: PHP-associated domain-containing protein [Actinopolymorphaceae bacterium]